MPRINRVDVGGEIYHILNRANARVQIFNNDADYKQFEEILEEAVVKMVADPISIFREPIQVSPYDPVE